CGTTNEMSVKTLRSAIDFDKPTTRRWAYTVREYDAKRSLNDSNLVGRKPQTRGGKRIKVPYTTHYYMRTTQDKSKQARTRIIIQGNYVLTGKGPRHRF